MNELPSRIANALEAGEHVVWHGQPTMRLWWMRPLRSLLTLLCVLGGAWYFRDPLFTGLPPAFVWLLLTIAVIIAGGLDLVLTLWRVVRPGAPMERAWYVVTNRRALILPPILWGVDRQRSYLPHQLVHARVFSGRLGVGSIVFESEGKWVGSRNRRYVVRHRGFFHIANQTASDVAAIINETLLADLPAVEQAAAPRGQNRESFLRGFTSTPRAHDVTHVGSSRLEIVPTLGSRLFALTYLALMLVILGGMYAAVTSAPIRQMLQRNLPDSVHLVHNGLKVIGLGVAIVFVGGAAVQAFERKAWFDRAANKFQPAGLFSGTSYDLSRIEAVQLVQIRKGVGSRGGERRWAAIRVKLEPPLPDSILICAVEQPGSDKESAPRWEAREIARELADFLQVKLLE